MEGDNIEGKKSGKIFDARHMKRLDLVSRTKESGNYLFQKALESKSGPFITLEDQEYKMMSSYDYLGLIGHPDIEKASTDAIKKFGTSTGGVRLLTGTNSLHLSFEKELANFKGTEAALSYSSGYHANIAVISALFGSKDLVLIDSKIHQSTFDACKLSGVSFRRFSHNDHKSLEKLLKLRENGKRILIISEGCFSMDGDICCLPEIVDLKNRYGALLMIDEAHSLGMLGKNGSGVDSHFGISPTEVDIFTGSLSKAIPANGGFVAGSKELISYLQHGSSPYIFSAAMGPASTAAAMASLKVMLKEPERHKTLHENSNYLRNALQELGYDTGETITPIIPVLLGEDEATFEFAKKLYENRILATPIVYPAVPRGQARLRLCVTASQDMNFLQEVIKVFKELSRNLNK